MTSAKCPNYGLPLTSGDKFCGRCGEPAATAGAVCTGAAGTGAGTAGAGATWAGTASADGA
jgi:hypothetical protein